MKPFFTFWALTTPVWLFVFGGFWFFVGRGYPNDWTGVDLVDWIGAFSGWAAAMGAVWIGWRHLKPMQDQVAAINREFQAQERAELNEIMRTARRIRKELGKVRFSVMPTLFLAYENDAVFPDDESIFRSYERALVRAEASLIELKDIAKHLDGPLVARQLISDFEEAIVPELEAFQENIRLTQILFRWDGVTRDRKTDRKAFEALANRIIRADEPIVGMGRRRRNAEKVVEEFWRNCRDLRDVNR